MASLSRSSPWMNVSMCCFMVRVCTVCTVCVCVLLYGAWSVCVMCVRDVRVFALMSYVLCCVG